MSLWMSPAVWSYCDQIERNINSTEKLWEIDVVLRIIELLIVFPDLWAGGHHRVALQRLPQGCLSSSSRRGLPCRGQRVHLTLWASLERLPQGCLPSSPIAGDCPVDSLRSESTFNPMFNLQLARWGKHLHFNLSLMVLTVLLSANSVTTL